MVSVVLTQGQLIWMERLETQAGGESMGLRNDCARRPRTSLFLTCGHLKNRQDNQMKSWLTREIHENDGAIGAGGCNTWEGRGCWRGEGGKVPWNGAASTPPPSTTLQCRPRIARSSHFSGKTRNPGFYVKFSNF